MKKISELDWLKAVAAIMVILIHVTAGPITELPHNTTWAVLMVINRLSKPSVPMFIFASGFGLFYTYRSISFRYGSFLKGRFTRILIPYLCWTVVYYVWHIYNGAYDFSISFFLKNLISGKMMYHLYYIVVILQYYILFGFFHIIVKRISEVVSIPLAFLLTLQAVYMMPDEYYGRSFTTYLVYFVLGCYFGKNYNRAISLVKRCIYPIGAGFLSTAAVYTGCFILSEGQSNGLFRTLEKLIYVPFSFFSTLVLLYFCMILQENKKMGELKKITKRATATILGIISEGCFYLYLSHPLMMGIVARLVSKGGMVSSMQLMGLQLAAIAIVVVPLSYTYVKIKTRLTRIIFH